MHILKVICAISPIALTCLAMSSCSDELPVGNLPTGNEIAFSTSVADGLTSRTSSPGSHRFEYLEPEAVASDFDETLYVHTLINEDCLNTMQSRGAQITDETLNSFIVSAYAYSGEWTEPGATKEPNFIRGTQVKKGETDLWVPTNKYFWPATESNVRFYGFANLPGTLLPNPNGTTLDYTVATDVKKQNDIIAALCDESTASHISSRAPVEMNFGHILTGIRFRTAKGDNVLSGYKIKEVGFEGVYGKGKFTLKEFEIDPETNLPLSITNRDKMWSLPGTQTATSFTVSLSTNENPNGINGAPDIPLTQGEQTLMMIPQHLPSGAKVVVTLVDKFGEEHKLAKTLAGDDWGMGQIITYVISSKAVLVEDVFELYKVTRENATGPIKENGEELVATPDKSDNTGSYTYDAPYYNYNLYDESRVSMTSHWSIRSYRRSYPKFVDGKPEGDIKEIPLDYTSSGSAEWITTGENTHEANPSIKGAYYDMVVESQPMEKRDPWSDILKTRTADQVMPEWSLDKSDGYYDLSKRYSKNDEGLEAEINTSNCYIVSAPGKYKFPVVYGNSIRHSKINTESFGGFKKEGTTGKKIEDYEFVADNPYVTSSKTLISHVTSHTGLQLNYFFYPYVENATTPSLIWSDVYSMVEPLAQSLADPKNSSDAQRVDIGKELGLYSTDLNSPDFLEEGKRFRVKYVYFEITPDNIRQGNVMMGFVSGTGGNFWSWHIWITPYVPNNYKGPGKDLGINDETNLTLLEEDQMLPSAGFTSSGETYTLMPYNLGWCHRVYLTFGTQDRDATYTFTQTETGKVITLKVHQPHTTDIQYGNNLLYQWGRKDPLRGCYSFRQYDDPILKPFYHKTKEGNVEQYIITPKETQAPVYEVLNAPQYVYGANGSFDDWNSVPSDILWRNSSAPAGCVRETDGKTVYDPSPVGHMISTSLAFPQFLENKDLVTFPITGIKSGDVYIPMCGYRNNLGKLAGGKEEAYYHASDANGMLYFSTKEGVAESEKQDLNKVISGAVRPRKDRRFIPEN